MQQSADGDLITSGGTIDVQAVDAAITMVTGAVSEATGGDIRYEAGTSIILGVLDARTATARSNGDLSGQDVWGSVTLLSSNGSITDADTTDSSVDIYALNLRMSATGDIGILGGSANAIDTEVVNLAVETTNAGDINILEDTDLIIGSVGGISIQRVAADATASTYPDPAETALNGLVTAGNGTIVVRTADGDLKVDEAVNANGSGNIL